MTDDNYRRNVGPAWWSATGVRVTRRKRGVSQAAAAAAVGVATNTWSRWETGKTRPRPQGPVAVALRRWLGGEAL